MSTLQELIAQRAAIEQEIAQTRTAQRAVAIEQIRKIMADNGISTADLSPKRTDRASAAAGQKVATKYRSEVMGETWSGRGLQPRWLKAAIASGKSISDFAV